MPIIDGVNSKYWEPIGEEVKGPLVSVVPSGFVMVTCILWNLSVAVMGIGCSQAVTSTNWFTPTGFGLTAKKARVSTSAALTKGTDAISAAVNNSKIKGIVIENIFFEDSLILKNCTFFPRLFSIKAFSI
jgi:hypothetical protein